MEALKNTGQRGIIGQGWGDLGTRECLPRIFLFKSYALQHHLVSFIKCPLPCDVYSECRICLEER